jgi:hypothetical protein
VNISGERMEEEHEVKKVGVEAYDDLEKDVKILEERVDVEAKEGWG